jgi:hypothetical protein
LDSFLQNASIQLQNKRVGKFPALLPKNVVVVSSALYQLEPNMNEDDQKIRKQWLIIWNLSFVINVLQLLFNVKNDSKMLELMQQGHFLILAILFSLIGSMFALFFYLGYRWAYKKHGTRFLIFCLGLSALGFLANPFFYTMGKITGLQWAWANVVGLIWIAVNWRLFKVNRKYILVPLERHPKQTD